MIRKFLRKKSLKRKFREWATFLIVFNILAIPLYVAIYTDFSFKPLQDMYARFLYWTLKLFGYHVSVGDYTVNLNYNGSSQDIKVSWDSTGWKSMYALVSLVLATPVVKLERKLRFAWVGLVVIAALNYLRISTTILASIIFGFNLFDVIHTVLWREGMILAVVVLWFFWMRKEKYNRGKI